jgi:hypothetical protein
MLEALIILAPVLLAIHLSANNADLRRVGAEQDARWRTGDLADSLSLAKQRSDARAGGSYSITASGDTLFPLVHVPSGRPASVAIAVVNQQEHRKARYAMAIILGLIPGVLILLTLSWMIVRRNEAGPPASFGAT